MTIYWVSTDLRNPGWWPDKEYPRYRINSRRPATPEETALMDKVEHLDISLEEIAELKKMIKRPKITEDS